jgi:glycosyltransferase involved in cell wall biosynthesis
MTESPIVSAIIPTKDRPMLVLRAVESVLRQTFRELEVVVVIDGPDTETRKTLEQLGDRRVRIFELEKSVGGAEARNIGARIARGAWLALLDDDDEWLSTKLAVQLGLAESSPAEKVLVASRFFFREPGYPDKASPRLLPHDRVRISEYPFASDSGFQTSVFFCSRRLLREVPFTSALRGMQDIDWFLRIMADPTVDLRVSPDVLSIYNSPANRATISANLRFEMPLSWAKANRSILTSRAYSLFIVRTCVRRAVEQRAGWRAFLRLFYECMFVGSPTPKIIFLFFVRYCLSDQARKKLRFNTF